MRDGFLLFEIKRKPRDYVKWIFLVFPRSMNYKEYLQRNVINCGNNMYFGVKRNIIFNAVSNKILNLREVVPLIL